MEQSATLLHDLTLVLCVGAAVSLLFQRLKQPLVLGYLLAGFLLGPHVTFMPSLAQEESIETLAELGVILVMFSIGLEFNARKLVSVLPTAGLTTVIQVGAMAWLGYTAGHLLGWKPLECVFAAAIVAVSSTMICAKVLMDQHKESRITKLVFGVLILEDLAAILFMAFLTPLAKGAHLSFRELLMTTGSLLAFLGLLLGAGFLLIPRIIRAVIALRSSETLLVAVVGICFAMALLAHKVGYSVALGAFLAGMLVAEAGVNVTVERLIHPLKDMFAAVFFVAVGMLVDPATLVKHWKAVLVFTLVVILGKIVSVTLGAFLSGRSLRTAVQAGMSLSQIGEFSFIIAQVGIATGAIRGHLYDVSVAVAVVSSFATPYLMRASDPIAGFVDSRLPKPLQTFTALYGTWLEKLRAGLVGTTVGKKAWRWTMLLFVDAFFVIVIIITTAATVKLWLPQLQEHLYIPRAYGRIILIGVGVVAAIPFLGGIIRGARVLGTLLGEAALPPAAEGKVDFGLAPRRALTLTLQLGILFALGFPILAFTQPFLPFGYSPVVFIFLTVVLGIIFWKRTVNLQGHIRAGAQMVAEALAHRTAKAQDDLMEQFNEMVPGIGAPTSVRISPGSAADGRALAELNLRSKMGASVIAISRGNERHLMPSGKEIVRGGDTLVLVGTHESIQQAKAFLNRAKDEPKAESA